MENRTLYIVWLSKKGEQVKKNTKESIASNLEKADATVSCYGEGEVFSSCKEQCNKIINDVFNFDYVCIVPNGSVLNISSKNIFNKYKLATKKDVKCVYLPFVLYNFKDESGNDNNVVLNKHMWNSAIAMDAGILDFDLALRQIDSTIFGGFIPVDVFFNEDNYNKDLKNYQQYYTINSIASNDDLIILGVPKMFLTIDDYDFSYISLSQEEKVKAYNQAREKWVKDDDENKEQVLNEVDELLNG